MKFKIVKPRLGNPLKILAAAFVIGLGGFWAIHHARAQTPGKADSAGTPTAAVAKVTREDLYKQVTIAAEFRPYEEVELHAKVSGYVKEMNVDFGDKVKAGQLLATLEVPELQDELQQCNCRRSKMPKPITKMRILIYTRLRRSTKNIPIWSPSKNSIRPKPMT